MWNVRSRYKHVCFKCRIGNKSGGQCTRCGTSMTCVGIKCPIPKKRDKRAWEALENDEMLTVSKNANRVRPIKTISGFWSKWNYSKKYSIRGEKKWKLTEENF